LLNLFLNILNMKIEIFKFSVLIIICLYLSYYFYSNESDYSLIKSLGSISLAVATMINLFVKLKKYKKE